MIFPEKRRLDGTSDFFFKYGTTAKIPFTIERPLYFNEISLLKDANKGTGE